MWKHLILLFYIIDNVISLTLHIPWTIGAGSTYNSYKFNVLHHLTAISPYFESNSEGLSPDPPQDCTIDKAIYQVRHGSIYVNEYDYTSIIQPFLIRLRRASDYGNFSGSTHLAFLSNWSSPISRSEEQIAKVAKLGFLEAFNLGTRLAYRYPDLVPVNENVPFRVWASDSNRTKKSAEALFYGLHSGHETIGHVVSVSEEKDRGANTLTPTRSCPKYNASTGTREANIWLNNYTVPIIARLNSMAPRFQFLPNDVLAMQELCGYETIIRGVSPFCGIFTPEEWLSFEYYFDIKYYNELGYGNDLSPSLGMPWVVATGDLLSHRKNEDQNLYISVAHRQLLPLILTALNLYNDSTLPHDRLHYQRVWKASSFISFLGHIALERLNCRSAAYNGAFVRILVSSTPVPLPGCASGPGASCPLQQYLDYVKSRSDSYQNFSGACEINKKDTVNRLNIFTSKDIE